MNNEYIGVFSWSFLSPFRNSKVWNTITYWCWCLRILFGQHSSPLLFCLLFSSLLCSECLRSSISRIQTERHDIHLVTQFPKMMRFFLLSVSILQKKMKNHLVNFTWPVFRISDDDDEDNEEDGIYLLTKSLSKRFVPLRVYLFYKRKTINLSK